MGDQLIVKNLARDGSNSIVTLKGVLKIEAVAELRQALVEALNESPRVVLDATLLEDLDMSILQTVCSACKTAAAQKKSFLFAGALPACMATLNSGIGAFQGASCIQNNNEPCIWLGGV